MRFATATMIAGGLAAARAQEAVRIMALGDSITGSPVRLPPFNSLVLFAMDTQTARCHGKKLDELSQLELQVHPTPRHDRQVTT